MNFDLVMSLESLLSSSADMQNMYMGGCFVLFWFCLKSVCVFSLGFPQVRPVLHPDIFHSFDGLNLKCLDY